MACLAYLSLGSNLGDREGYLSAAINRLGDLGRVISVSSIYETEPVEFTRQPWFLNMAVALETERTAEQLVSETLEIEQHLGRVRAAQKGPRVIDIDILLFGNEVIQSPKLTIPHPAMQHRRFVLEPLVEIASEARHPVLGGTVRELLDALPQGQTVRKLAAPARQPITE